MTNPAIKKRLFRMHFCGYSYFSDILIYFTLIDTQFSPNVYNDVPTCARRSVPAFEIDVTENGDFKRAKSIYIVFSMENTLTDRAGTKIFFFWILLWI